ncbi:hypothetical protein ACVWZZ_005183 [Bradyrhizobium sp. LM6.10]
MFADLERIAGRFPHALWHSPKGKRDVVIWCSNDYLGMGQHPKVVGAMVETATRVGTGAGGTRNIAGTHHPLVQLEAELADLHGKDASLLFTSGYVSNQTGIATIAKLIPNCLILSDELNHNSMIEGIRQSGCERVVFRHNDLADLEALLKAAGPEPAQADRLREPLFDGRRYRPARKNLRSRREVRRDDLCRRSPRRRHVRPARRRHRRARRRDASHRHSRRHARQGVRLPRRLHRRQRTDHRRRALLCAGLHLHHRAAAGDLLGRHRCDQASEDVELGARAPPGPRRPGQGDPQRRRPAGDVERHPHRAAVHRRCREVPKQASDLLLEQHGIYIQPINYPTVAKGTERLRITPSPYHDDGLVDQLAEALLQVWDRLGLPLREKSLAAE